MQILITFIIISIICLILTYYFNLFISKSVYTRSELSNILPQLGSMINTIYYRYSIIYLAGFYLLSGLMGILLLSLFENWIINSALIPVILFYSAPKLAVYFEQTRVTISENYKDIAEALYSKYYNYILSGFSAGYASKLIENCFTNSFISFTWFIINFLIIIAIAVLALRNDIFE
ncbi:MAG: hypothetical protein CVV49_06015 [Spirochaetae bacterium HGW-Spirochaetae-5]|nr:MAG: hypothetical protein CVV49_06015 [Spirochaetae bacterium HGW-Spirochaetae-5]